MPDAIEAKLHQATHDRNEAPWGVVERVLWPGSQWTASSGGGYSHCNNVQGDCLLSLAEYSDE